MRDLANMDCELYASKGAFTKQAIGKIIVIA